jgi:hypothetical protein
MFDDCGVLMLRPFDCCFMFIRFVSIDDRLEFVCSICIFPFLFGV